MGNGMRGLFAAGMILGATADAWANGNVHVSRFWHNHQPLYWPEWNSNGPQTQRGQYAWDSIVLKPTQNYGGLSPRNNPENNLTDIFGLDDRRNAYQSGPRNSLTTFSGGGFALSYSGSLIDNVRQLGGGGHLGYGGNWNSGNTEARNWGRLDLVGFTYHHSLAPLLPKEVLRKEIQTFKQAWWKAWGGNANLSDHSKGFFPTEMGYSRHIVDVLVEEGYEWVIVASHHISRTSPSYNNVANPEGSYNIFSSPPNKADQLGPTFNDGWWYLQPNPGNAAWNVAPFAYQLHRVQYVNPENGQVSEMVAVPSDDALSYRYGYANEGIGKIQAHIAPFANDPNRPVIVMPSTDGDNAWGGGNSSWFEATPQFFNESASAGYVKNMPGNFVNAFKQHAPVTHIEDGAWIFPEMCYGSPNFLKWLEPPVKLGSPTAVPGTMVDMESPGFNLKFFSYAPLMAGANWVITAEQILRDQGGEVRPWVVQAPYDWDGNGFGDRNDVELAWHIYLKGLDSGFNYYGGLGNDDEVKPGLATKRAIDKLQSFMSTRMNEDRTGPTVFKPQRFPYNPGWFTFGWFNSIPGDTRFLKRMGSDFYIWTHAYDLSGVQTINVKVRIDNDGVNSMANNQNETYAGGSDVGAWVTIPMTKRELPKTRAALNAAANHGDIDYFVFDPAFWANPQIADYYFVKITEDNLPGFRGKLLDYYIEAADTRGNLSKSEIQHVWVEDDGVAPSSSVQWSSDPRDCAPLTVTYNSNNGPLSNSVPVKMFISFNNGSTFTPYVMTNASAGVHVYTVGVVPDNAPSAIVYFQNNAETLTDNRNGQNWQTNIRDCDVVTGPGAASTLPANPSGCNPITIRYFPNTGNLQNANPVYIHIGRNGWQDVMDPRPVMTKVSNYWEYVFNTPTNTTQINFVFTTAATGGAGQWDNNSGTDWNINVANCGDTPPPPQTVSISPTNPVGCGPITITYNPSGRNLLGAPQVYIHIGRNGWQDVIQPNPAMTAAGANWTYTYTPLPGTTNINMVFNNGGATWDNNGGADWHVTVTGCEEGPQPPTGFAITNPPANITVGNAVATYDLQGIADNVVGQIRWTNTLNGAAGTIPVANPWTISALPLGVGVNVITVTGTNAGSSVATNAIDSSAAYGDSWANGSNLGTGFSPWELEAVGMAGHFVNATGWGLWSHEPTNYSAAVRPFPAPLAAGQTFHIRMKNGWIWENGGSVGVALRDTDGKEQWLLYFVGGATNYAGTHTTDIGWTDAGLDIAFTLLNATSYSVAVTPVGGGATRTFTGAITGQIHNVRAWSYGNGTGDEFNSNRDYFINNLKITSAGGGSGTSTSATVVITRDGSGADDSNGDGIPDWWYVKYGLNPNTPNLASQMTPGNNATYWEEFLYDTDPTDPGSFNPNRIVFDAGDGVVISLSVQSPTSTNRWYDVWWATSLFESAWTPMNFNRPGHANQAPVWFSVTNDAPVKYYRTGAKLPAP